MQVDHVNHDTLDNRRGNLRIVSQSVNMHNRSERPKNCFWNKGMRRWIAMYKHDGARIYVGQFFSFKDGQAAVEQHKRKTMRDFTAPYLIS